MISSNTLFQFPKIRHLRKSRHPDDALTACFQYVACGLWIAFYVSGRIAAMQSIAMTTDDIENREISAAEIHGLCPEAIFSRVIRASVRICETSCSGVNMAG